MKKKIIWFSFIVLFSLVAAYGINYCWKSFPVVSGYTAKYAASNIFVGGREEKSLREEDLGAFPFTLAGFSVSYTDSSVTASVAGLAKRKAIYRKGLGCTLVQGMTEQQLRNQHFNLPVKSNNADSSFWPDIITDTFHSINNDKLSEAVNFAFTEPDPQHKLFTRAVVVIYDGKLVAEKYAPGFNKNSILPGWSMTKSIFSALTGIMVKDGRLQVNMPAPVSEWQGQNDRRKNITIKDILQQSTGLDFEEDYAKSSDATKMLFGSADMAAYTASRPLKYKPGSVFYYSSGNTNILSRIMRNRLGDSLYYRYPNEKLFNKLGMNSAVIEPDPSGTFVGSSYMFATARDWAKFGLLYLQDGVWNGERILPEGWVKATQMPAPATPKLEYGYMFWLNGFDDNTPHLRRFKDVPSDMYCAAGFGGQKVFIIPSEKLVVVRLGVNKIDENEFLRKVIGSINN